MRQYDYAVFIGRFEPFHNAHKRVIDRALSVADKVICVIGSARKPRSPKNPWFASERQVMIRRSFAAPESARLRFGEVGDFTSDERWIREVQQAVAAAIVSDRDNALLAGAKVCLVGHFKDRSTDYLKMFPQWSLVEVANFEERNATDIRHLYFESADAAQANGKRLMIESAVPDAVHDFLEEFRGTPAFAQLAREHAFVRDYRKQFEALPYPPIFVTTDAVVACAGHVLLVKRRAEPGKGLWALPGGFLQPDERLLDGCLRELREETRLKVPEPVIRGSLRAAQVFDEPARSLRGRTVTHAFYFELAAGDLPAVKGSDDAAKARWVPLAEAFGMESQFFEDHFQILGHFLGV